MKNNNIYSVYIKFNDYYNNLYNLIGSYKNLNNAFEVINYYLNKYDCKEIKIEKNLIKEN